MSTPSRLLASFTCVGAIGLAAWLLHEPAAPSAKPAAQTANFTPGLILDRLPKPDASTPLGKAYATAMQKVRQAPGKAAPWIQVGDVLAQMQRDSASPVFYDHAESVYREALSLQPKALEALTGMAWVTGGRHQFDDSIDWAHKALAVDENCIFAYGILGDAEVELGQYDEAMDHYQKMMDLRPDLSSWSRGAHLLWLTGNKSKAMWLMEKALGAGAPFAENTAWCRAKLANMLFQDGALLPAQQVLQPALKNETQNAPVLLIAAKLAAAQENYTLASERYQAILKLRPNLEALAGLSDLLFAQGKLEESLAYDQQVVELHAKNLQTGVHDHSFMAKFYADRDRNLPEALKLEEPHKGTKNLTEADTVAWVYFKNGDLPTAVAAMKRALKHNTQDAEMHYHAGLIAAAFGDRTSAKKHLETALQYNPNFSPRHAPLARKALEDLSNDRQVGQTATNATR